MVLHGMLDEAMAEVYVLGIIQQVQQLHTSSTSHLTRHFQLQLCTFTHTAAVILDDSYPQGTCKCLAKSPWEALEIGFTAVAQGICLKFFALLLSCQQFLTSVFATVARSFFSLAAESLAIVFATVAQGVC